MNDSELEELIGNLSFITAMHKFYIGRLLDAEQQIKTILEFEN